MKRGLRILVTGGCSGLGAHIVRTLMDHGHTCVIFDKKLGDNVADIDHEKLGKLVAYNLAGGVDVLINCAGINHNEWFEEVSPFSIHRVMEVNAIGPVMMTQALLPQLKASKGTVINIVSNASTIPMTSSLAYNMSKAAALMATKQMAHELTPKYGITVFSVSPNKLAGTEMSRQIEENVQKVRGWTREFAREYQKKALMHGLETPPQAVADTIANLVSSGNMLYLSGCDIPFGK
jgi:meso-butanediol dehydrogenase/(S,S)-butanediol dehydrogenase/diacetyl reductase